MNSRLARSTKQGVVIPYKPMPWQLQVHNCSARFKIIVNGRQTGKTTLALHHVVKAALEKPNSIYYWVDPTHKFSLKCLEIFKREYPTALRKQLGIKIKSSADDRSLIFEKNGSKLVFFTAQSPDALVGDAIDGVVVNEAGLIENPDMWDMMLRPALGVKSGWALFISSPRNKNWFYDLFNQGKEGCLDWQNDYLNRDMTCKSTGKAHLYHSFHNPTSPETSKMSASEIEIARSSPSMTARKFRTEYLAEFLEEQSEVFSNFRQCIRGSYESPNSTRNYSTGVDLGKVNDFTVISVVDRQTGHLVHWQRIKDKPWPLIEQSIIGVNRRYGGRIIIDGTGVGDAICSNLKKFIPNLEVFVISNKTKVDLIENMVSLIEREEVTFPDQPELTQELSEFKFRLTIHGNPIYEGRSQGHDDCVISLGLAYWGLRSKAISQPTYKEARLIRRAWGL